MSYYENFDGLLVQDIRSSVLPALVLVVIDIYLELMI